MEFHKSQFYVPMLFSPLEEISHGFGDGYHQYAVNTHHISLSLADSVSVGVILDHYC